MTFRLRGSRREKCRAPCWRAFALRAARAVQRLACCPAMLPSLQIAQSAQGHGREQQLRSWTVAPNRWLIEATVKRESCQKCAACKVGDLGQRSHVTRPFRGIGEADRGRLKGQPHSEVTGWLIGAYP